MIHDFAYWASRNTHSILMCVVKKVVVLGEVGGCNALMVADGTCGDIGGRTPGDEYRESVGAVMLIVVSV